MRSLVQFDVAALGTNKDIIDAKFKLWLWGGVSTDLEQRVYRVTRDWSAATATWNDPWNTPGGDYDDSKYWRKTAGGFGQWISWENGTENIRELVRRWYRWPNDYAQNMGLLVRAGDEVTAYMRKYYLSNEMYSEADRRPLLEVGYQYNGYLWNYTPGQMLYLTYKWGGNIEQEPAWKTYFQQSTSDWTSTPTPISWSYSANGQVDFEIHDIPGGDAGGWSEWEEFGVKYRGVAWINPAYLADKTDNYRRAIVGHELGHAVNLTDIWWQDPDWGGWKYHTLMGYDPDYWNTNYVPQPDDVDRVNSIYPNP